MFEHRHLIVDESLRFVLEHLEHAGILFVEDQDASVLEMIAGIQLTGGSLFHGDGDRGLVGVRNRFDWRRFIDQQA